MRKQLLLLLSVLCLAFTSFAQVKVTGTVVDEDKEPLMGATIIVKGSPSIGTSTDLDGHFSINAPSANSTLVVSYVGMGSVEVKANAKQPLVVTLQNDGVMLQEVVATGMQKVDKRMTTGATTKISAEKAKLDGVADISRALEGRAAGVSVQNVSGSFGTAPKIRVRGATSIYGNSKPLWVVDGVILEDAVDISADDLSSGDAVTLISSAIAGLNADDIESFDILKDGSATSIYGAKAMAGVIVVTTKSGRKGHTQVNYTGEFTLRLKPSYRDFNICNSQEQMGIYKEMEAKGWLEFASLANSSSSGIYGTMYKLINSYQNGHYGLENTPAAMGRYLREAEYRNTDWFDLLFKSNITQNHAVSVSGGTDKGSFYTSLSIMNDPGWTLQNQVQRYTFNANASYDISNTLKIKLLTSDSYRQQKAPGTLSQDIDVVGGGITRSFDINPYSYALNTSRASDPYTTYTRNYADFNIFHELENNYIDLTVTDVKFQAELNWRPFRGLELNAVGAFRHQESKQNMNVLDDANQANAYRVGIIPENSTIRDRNPYLYTDPDDPTALPTTVLPKGGMLFHNLYSMTQYNFRGSASYSAEFNNKHLINVFVGSEIGSMDRHHEEFTGYGICYDNGHLPYIDYRMFKQMVEENGSYFGDTWTYTRDVAFFGTGTYTFGGKYIVNGTFRYEGTNKLGKSRKSRWLPTWNVSGAWNAHEESFFREKVGNWWTHAKARISYSLTADAGPSYVSNALPIYSPTKPWRPNGDTQELGIALDDLANSELTYEKKHELNVGADLGFIDNRINLAFDWYKRDNFDLIGSIYTQGVGGVNKKYANVATMKSHGVEFTLSTENIVTKDFTWTTDFTFAYAKNKITSLESRSRVIDLVPGTGYALQGYPVRAVFSFPFMGLNDEGLPTTINEYGELTVSDINFQEFEKLDHLVYSGPVDPLYSGGFGNQFRWKNWHANVFFTYSFGNVLRLDRVFSYSYSDMTAMPKEFKNRWIQPGDEAYTSIPVIASRRQYQNDRYLNYAYNAYNYSTERIAHGDFIRLKEISVTYDLPKIALQKLRLNNASVKLQATNIALLYADKKLNGADPEFFNSGGVANPMPKQFTLTVRFGL
ncbi:MAG: SusC/RagA family TonB-linked outer membrane protein [Muribaculaceae bacterium]|nr:SusC/RagA family TonB-linked outer membrane protein [Muribaculaceae bacterium]